MTMYPLVDYPKYREPFSTLAELMVAVDMLDPTLNYPLSWHFHDEDPDDEPCFSIAIMMPRRTEVTEFEVQGPFDRAEIDAWLNTTIRARVAAWYGWDERPVPPTNEPIERLPGYRTVEEARIAAEQTLASGDTTNAVIVRGEPSPHPPTREQIAEAIAKAEDADYWVDEVRQWEALERWERDAQPQEYPGMAYEDRESFLRTADAVALIQNGADR